MEDRRITELLLYLDRLTSLSHARVDVIAEVKEVMAAIKEELKL